MGQVGWDVRFACSCNAFGLPWHQEDSKLDLNLCFVLFLILNYTKDSPGKDFSFLTRGVALRQVN